MHCLLECLSFRRLREIYKHYFINLYSNTFREDRRKPPWDRAQSHSAEAARDTEAMPQVCTLLRSLANSGPKPGHLLLELCVGAQP